MKNVVEYVVALDTPLNERQVEGFTIADMSDPGKFRVSFIDGTTDEFETVEVLPDGLLKARKAQASKNSGVLGGRTRTDLVVRCYPPHFWRWFETIEKPSPLTPASPASAPPGR